MFRECEVAAAPRKRSAELPDSDWEWASAWAVRPSLPLNCLISCACSLLARLAGTLGCALLFARLSKNYSSV